MNTKTTETENKMSGNSSLVTATVLNIKIGEVKKKVPDHGKDITTQEFNKVIAEDFAARLKQADLVSRTDFDNKLISFNTQITSNKTKYLEVRKIIYINSLMSLSANTWYIRIKKEANVVIMFLVGNRSEFLY